MPQLRPSDATKDICPRCGTALIQFVVHSGGRRQHCRTCGLLRADNSVPSDSAESSAPANSNHLLCYAQAVLQAVHQVRGCRRCQAHHLSSLRLIADQIEQQRAVYVQTPHQWNEQQIDAFLDEMTEQLQGGIGHLCCACKRRMELLTWELFVSLLLENREHKEP
jgi:hypothetical protein